MDKIKAFLKQGYLPIQIPPGFTTHSFAENHEIYGPIWESKKAPRCRVEKFSVARSSYNRRITGIINPVAYYFLVTELTKNWAEIQVHYSQSMLSLSSPTIEPSLRSIKISKFSDLYEAKISKSPGFRYALLTDISRFFPSIYTHTIPWALHGKEAAKINQKDNTQKYFGNLIDKRSMGVQDWQTIGLPIGPDTSHVIAEIIGVAIDVELKQHLGYWPNGFRYVDDFCIFFETKIEAEKALTELTKIIGKYELQINPSKTKIIEVKELVKESWKYSVKQIDISDDIKKQKDDLHNFFERIFSLEAKFNDESIVKYALKMISSKIIKLPNWSLFEAYLLKCGFSFPNSLQVIASLFSTYNKYSYPLNKTAIQRFCNSMIRDHSISDGHSEMAWSLWMIKELGIELSKESLHAIESSSSSVCILIALDLCNNGYCTEIFPESLLNKFARQDALYGENWLLAYEGGKRCWLNNSDAKFIEKDPFFSILLNNYISFYDEKISISPIFEIKPEQILGFDLNALFESNKDIKDHFEFEDDDDEYFDLVSEEDKNEFEEDDEPDWDIPDF